MPTYLNSNGTDVTIDGIRIPANTSVEIYQILITLPSGVTKLSDLPVIGGLLLDDTLIGDTAGSDSASLTSFPYAVTIRLECTAGEADIYFNTTASDKIATLKAGEGYQIETGSYNVSSIIAEFTADTSILRVRVSSAGVQSAFRFGGGTSSGGSSGAYEDPAVIVTAQDLTASYVNFGAEIEMEGYNRLGIYVDKDVNNSLNVYLKVFGMHTTGGDLYEIDAGGVKTLWTTGAVDGKTYIEFDVGTAPFIQLQGKASTVGATAGDLTITIDKKWRD